MLYYYVCDNAVTKCTMLSQKRTTGITLSFLVYATNFEIADFELLMNFVLKINQFWQIYFEISKEIENTKFVTIFLNDFQHRFVRNPKKYKMCDTKMQW